MDTSDIAAAAIRPNRTGRCNCATGKKRPKPKCPKCKGTGKITVCENCEGAGWDIKNNRGCLRCQSTGCL